MADMKETWKITLCDGTEKEISMRYPSLEDFDFYNANRDVFDEMRQPKARLFGTRFWQDREFFNQVFDRVFEPQGFDWKSDVQVASMPVMLNAYKAWLSIFLEGAKAFLEDESIQGDIVTEAPDAAEHSEAE